MHKYLSVLNDQIPEWAPGLCRSGQGARSLDARASEGILPRRD